MTRLMSIPVIPPGVPVINSTRVSALICPRLRWSPAAVVPGCGEGVGVPGQGRVHRDALVGGQQRRQVGHAVRGGAQTHRPLRRGVAGALGDGA